MDIDNLCNNFDKNLTVNCNEDEMNILIENIELLNKYIDQRVSDEEKLEILPEIISKVEKTNDHYDRILCLDQYYYESENYTQQEFIECVKMFLNKYYAETNTKGKILLSLGLYDTIYHGIKYSQFFIYHKNIMKY